MRPIDRSHGILRALCGARRSWLAALAVGIPLTCGSTSGDPQVVVRWAFGAQVGAEGEERWVPVREHMELPSGTRLGLLVEPRSAGYVYVLRRGPEGSFTTLLPPGGSWDDEGAEAGEVHAIAPAGGSLVVGESSGVEVWYLLAAPDRLSRLESLLAARRDETSGDADVLAEIERLETERAPLARPAERPITIGGAVKGDPQAGSLGALAVEFSARNLVYRSVTVEHR